MVWQSSHGKAQHVVARQVWAVAVRCDLACSGWFWQVQARLVGACSGSPALVGLGMSSPGAVWRGRFRHGESDRVEASHGTAAQAWLV